MNFQDLLAKMKELDESMAVMAPPSEPRFDAQAGATDECSGMPPKAGGPGLAGDDEVLTGECGCGGEEEHGGPQISIRSLIAALQAIEQGAAGGHEHGADIELFGMDETQPDGGFETATTEPNPQTADVAAVTRTGNDLASKGKEAVKMNGGGNPMQESLIRKLSDHYESLKAR